jgi:alpha-D-xyloside xylohydrolase
MKMSYSVLVSRDDGAQWRRDGETMFVRPWGQDGIRVQITVQRDLLDLPNALLDKPPKSDAVVDVDEDGATVTNSGIVCTISRSGKVSFASSVTGDVLLSEWDRSFMSNGGSFRVRQRFYPREGEQFYGLGQQQHGRLNQKGCVIELQQLNTQVSIPFMYSSCGYGFLWNHPGTGRVELGMNWTRWAADAMRQVDYVVVAGDTPADVMRRYAEITGFPTAFPDWASGFWQCKLRYRTQDELMSVAREYKERNLPISVIVIDYFHWSIMGEWDFDKEEWPDPDAMVRELDEMGIKLMVSVWPTVNPRCARYTEMLDRGMLVRTENGVPVHIRMSDKEHGRHLVFYDATNPEARAYVWDMVRKTHHSRGIDVYWLDACEPELIPPHHHNVRYHLGNGAEVGCMYPLLHEQGFYEGMKDEGQEKVLNLCRSAWAGSQRYGAAVWSGDISSTFDSLSRQVPAGLNMAMSGIPWWTTDVGGFTGGDVDDPAFRELLLRWFQYAVFCPILRLHGWRKAREGEATGPNEVWSYGDEAYDILREQLALRERIRPYVEEQMLIAHQTGTPPMRPLFFDFHDDPTAWGVEDAFMFGADILVAPVTAAGVRRRHVYLPAGTDWVDAWSGDAAKGGETVQAAAPIERIPVFLRAGADPDLLG